MCLASIFFSSKNTVIEYAWGGKEERTGCIHITCLSHELNGDLLRATLETACYFEDLGLESLLSDGKIIFGPPKGLSEARIARCAGDPGMIF